MEEFIPYLVRFSYLGIFAMLILFSFVSPFSKTLVIVASGVLASQGIGNLYLFIAVGIAGLVTADSMYFSVGYLWGEKILAMRYFAKPGKRDKLIEAERRFRKHGWLAVFGARFTPFIRGIIFMVAGASGMSWSSFLQADGLSALVVAPLAALAGYAFAEKHAQIADYIGEGENLLALIAAALILCMILDFWRRRGKGR